MMMGRVVVIYWFFLVMMLSCGDDGDGKRCSIWVFSGDDGDEG